MSEQNSHHDDPPEILDIGCGNDKVDGATGIDIMDTPSADLVRDVEAEGLPYPNDSISEIYAQMALEHMDAEAVIAECNRVLEPGGSLHIKLPHPFTTGFWQDWTHEIQAGFTREGITYLDSDHDMHYEHEIGSWDVESIHVKFWLNFNSLPGRVISASISVLASLASDKTREELLKLPFAGGWITADLTKQKNND